MQGRKFVLACTVTLATLVGADLEGISSFTIPSFDYGSFQDGDTPDRLLQALERGGIIALKNIPNYANVRERFLTSAVQCAVASEHVDEGRRYLSIKTFNDGTRRLTLRAAAGRELINTDIDSLKVMAATCPGHRELYEDFSSTIERAVDTFALALEKTKFTMGDGERSISARKLIADAKRLDHFHAYEAAPISPISSHRSLLVENIEQDLSLGMHEDHGLFVAMAAPSFYSVNGQNENIRKRRFESDASGLVIGSIELDEIVRPELRADELVIMIGTGASRWLETSHHLPAVMHGMRMPKETVWDDEITPGQRNFRAWFGKMTMLPSYQRLVETRLSFAQFANLSTRHLQANGNSKDDLKAIGCAGGRRLVESEGSCTYRFCTLRPGVEKPPTVGCQQACNYNMGFFNDKCAKKCDCTGTTTQTDECWMLCVPQLPVKECALKDQKCSGLKLICTANDTTPIATSAPVAPTEAPACTPMQMPPTANDTNSIATSAPVGRTEAPAFAPMQMPTTTSQGAPMPSTFLAPQGV